MKKDWMLAAAVIDRTVPLLLPSYWYVDGTVDLITVNITHRGQVL